jgi:hypothetical protein
LKKSVAWTGIIASVLILNLLYANCAGHAPEQETSLSSQAACGDGLPESTRSPATIEQLITLINQLPKPLSIDCLIKSLKRPLKVFSVDSPSSLQPSLGMDNPRIFIINGNLVLSVVPKGPGRFLLEMGQKVSSTGSIKGELQFPVATELTHDSPYSRILENGNGTSCRTCHTNEGRAVGTPSAYSYQSTLIPPSEQSRVDKIYLKSAAQFCNSSTDAYRCQMLRAIFIDGQAQDVAFPQ